MFTYDGRTLAGDYSQAINKLDGLADRHRQKRDDKETLSLAENAMADGILDAKELITLNQRDPKAAQALFQLDQQKRGDKLQEMQAKNAANFNETSALLNMSSSERKSYLTQQAVERQQKGEDISRDLQLLNMDDDQLIASLRKKQIDSGDFDKLFKAGVVGQQKDTRTKEKKLFDEVNADESGEFGSFVDRNNQSKATKITNNVGGGNLPFKIPNGFMLKDQNDPSKGVQPIPGASTDKSVAGDAGKIQMLRSAQKAYADVEKLIFDEDGSLSNTNLAASFLNLPASKGRSINQKMEVGIQAITRLETGAAMPPGEVKNTRKRFQPVIGDSSEQAKAKLDLFKDFINGSVKLIDPSGRFNDDRFQTELDNRIKKADVEKPSRRRRSSDKPKEVKRLKFNPATGRLE